PFAGEEVGHGHVGRGPGAASTGGEVCPQGDGKCPAADALLADHHRHLRALEIDPAELLAKPPVLLLWGGCEADDGTVHRFGNLELESQLRRFGRDHELKGPGGRGAVVTGEGAGEDDPLPAPGEGAQALVCATDLERVLELDVPSLLWGCSGCAASR